MRYPDFILAGAHKCGTTSLLDTLGKHPEIGISRNKEPHYFCFEKMRHNKTDVVGELKEYLNLFPEREKIVGEASVFYLYYHEIVIKSLLDEVGKNVKIIICLRDPVARAYSAYLDVAGKNELENETFETGLALETERKNLDYIPPSMHYVSVGMYSRMVKAYLEAFTNVHIVNFEDLHKNPEMVLEELQSFLEVEFVPLVMGKKNQGGREWRYKSLGALAKGVFPRRTRGYLRKMSPGLYGMATGFANGFLKNTAHGANVDTLDALLAVFQEDREELFKLTGVRI